MSRRVSRIVRPRDLHRALLLISLLQVRRAISADTPMFRFAPFVVAAVIAFSAGCAQPSSELPLPPAIRTDPPLPPGASDISNRPFAKPLSVADAEQILLLTEIFQYGDSSRQVQAYNAVWDQRDATERFRALSARARWAGQLYALCGLTMLDPVEAARIAQRLSTVEDRILAFESDWVRERPVAELVNLIRERKVADTLRSLKEVPVQIAVQGQIVFASAPGGSVTSDSANTIYIPAAYSSQQVSGTFASDTLVVAFGGGTAAGGVRAGSLSIKEGSGEIVRGFSGWRDGCVARMRRARDGVARFQVEFSLTTDPAATCSADSTRK
jgi:hypothetical protein